MICLLMKLANDRLGCGLFLIKTVGRCILVLEVNTMTELKTLSVFSLPKISNISLRVLLVLRIRG